MNELMELLEMQKDLDALIQEAVGDLTVNEFQVLQEAGILGEAGGAKKAVLKAGLETVGNAAAKLKNSNFLKSIKAKSNAVVPVGSARTTYDRHLPSNLKRAGLRLRRHAGEAGAAIKSAGSAVKSAAGKKSTQIGAGVAAGTAAGAAGATQSPINKANAIYKQTGNAVMACKSIFKDSAKVKACAAKLYASKGGASKLQKLRDIAQSAL